MSRWIGPSPEHDHIGAVLAAAEAWRDRCFMSDGSLFGEEALWTRANLQELKSRLIGNPAQGSGLPFHERHKARLRSPPPVVTHLAAEVWWFLFLFQWAGSGGRDKPRTKRDRVKNIWEWSGSKLAERHPLLDDEVLKGVGRTGVALTTHLKDQLEYLLDTVAKWKDEPWRDKLLILGAPKYFPQDFVIWLDETAKEGGGQPPQRAMRNMLLYLLFPDYMERIINIRQKKGIVRRFQNRLPKELQNRLPSFTPVEIDRALYEIRNALERERGNKIDFYFLDLHASRTEEGYVLVPSTPEETNDTELSSHSERHGALNTILYGPPGTGKTYDTVRQCVKLCDGSADRTSDGIHERYRALVEAGRVEFITFHQSYGYEEFVEGLRPAIGPEVSGENSGGGFRLVATDGVLKRIAERASESPVPHVLVIDEINRANVSKVLGELVTLLEEDKRANEENEVAVTLPHSGDRFTLPANLHILGTMNTADRSIALLDTAIRRRFEFVELAPNPDALREAEQSTGVDLPGVLRAMNRRLEWLIDRDHLIGHAWLMTARSREDVDRIMRSKIIPLLAEYFYDDWMKVRAVLGGTDDFVQSERLDPPPGLDDTGEERYRWTPREEFADDAYERLVSGRSDSIADSEDEG